MTTVSKGDFAHFMLKEIFEQPASSKNALRDLASVNELTPDFFGPKGANIFAKTKGILILACGTSYHAGQLARYWIERLANVPVTIELANEYRFRQSVFRPDHLVVAISQSGGTSDTVAAVEAAKKAGHEYLLSICNVEESSLMSMADLTFPTRTGPEIGIASTKALIGQLVGLYLLALLLAKLNNNMDADKLEQSFQALKALPEAIEKTLKLQPTIQNWAKQFKDRHNALFIGRQLDYPMAMEGALKLKETSYIHSEAFAAGEFRHGPMALIDETMATIAMATDNDLLDSMKTIVGEIVDKKGPVFVVTDESAKWAESELVSVVTVPDFCPMLSPILHVIPLQLLAYHTTLEKGLDVDQPRNLVKEVLAE